MEKVCGIWPDFSECIPSDRKLFLVPRAARICMDAGKCHFDSGTVGIRVADGSAVPSARRRIRTAVPGPAVAGSAETGAVGLFFR